MVPGDPLDPKTRLGCSSRRSSVENVARYVELGRREGARLVAGGNPVSIDGKGAFFEATVFDGVTPSMTIAREEIFGPVLADADVQGRGGGGRDRQTRRSTASPPPSGRAT
jgi:acyl-CoA reductase-like NAD-dependent aldehyde dehydrogenase